ncbi:MAG TPA: glycosyltransferase family 2 protein [Candidatus Acidoferrales bacterium]|nr:glycosyltransferase family 2 protein [Candidatus Acidoferrales bacterium]
MTAQSDQGDTKCGVWPKISLITPSLNSVQYIEQTILSVISQQYPNLEYFILDGGSTDGTLDIIRKYERQLSGWTSEPDNGMYDALNRGFARTSGGIMGWISATDKLHTGSLMVVGSVFRALPQVEWITGRPTGFTEEGMATGVSSLRRWSRSRFLAGCNRHIQQESTFWRRSLWEKSGGYVDASRREGSDFELWVRFFRHARLYSVNALIGGFRVHYDSLGLTKPVECQRIHDEIIAAERSRTRWGAGFAAFDRLGRAVLKVPLLNVLWRHTVESALIRLPAPDLAPRIRYRNNRWTLG